MNLYYGFNISASECDVMTRAYNAACNISLWE